MVKNIFNFHSSIPFFCEILRAEWIKFQEFLKYIFLVNVNA